MQDKRIRVIVFKGKRYGVEQVNIECKIVIDLT